MFKSSSNNNSSSNLSRGTLGGPRNVVTHAHCWCLGLDQFERVFACAGVFGLYLVCFTTVVLISSVISYTNTISQSGAIAFALHHTSPHGFIESHTSSRFNKTIDHALCSHISAQQQPCLCDRHGTLVRSIQRDIQSRPHCLQAKSINYLDMYGILRYRSTQPYTIAALQQHSWLCVSYGALVFVFVLLVVVCAVFSRISNHDHNFRQNQAPSVCNCRIMCSTLARRLDHAAGLVWLMR